MLVVSKDHGWTAYCHESEYLYCADDLGKALALFHEDEEVVARCIASIAKEPEGPVAVAIVYAIQRDLDDLDFELDASAFMNWDAEVEEAVIENIEYAGHEDEQRIVSSSRSPPKCECRHRSIFRSATASTKIMSLLEGRLRTSRSNTVIRSR
nr:hypothetical protein [Mesorhizobium caraganae]